MAWHHSTFKVCDNDEAKLTCVVCQEKGMKVVIVLKVVNRVKVKTQQIYRFTCESIQCSLVN